jgi:hypothetical protein
VVDWLRADVRDAPFVVSADAPRRRAAGSVFEGAALLFASLS